MASAPVSPLACRMRSGVQKSGGTVAATSGRTVAATGVPGSTGQPAVAGDAATAQKTTATAHDITSHARLFMPAVYVR
jgi:hypothetical protein